MTTGVVRRPYDRKVDPERRSWWSRFLVSLDLMLDDIIRVSWGSFFGNEIGWSQAAAVQNQWYEITSVNVSNANLYRTTGSAPAGRITVPYTGVYMINWAAAVSSSIVSKHLQVGINLVGSGVFSQGINHVNASAANGQLALSGTAILQLTAGSSVSLATRTTDTGTPTIDVDHVHMTVYQIGG